MRKYCVIGYPVGHSRSPQLFERFSTERGLVYGTDVIYERNEIENKEELLRFVDELKTGIWSGCNVTMPWKTEMMQYMDDISDIARITDAVNTISSKRGKLYGDSTDGRGMLNPLKDVLGKERIGAMVILGCGGAARSIIAEALLRNTGKVTIICRGINEDMSSGSGQNEENSQKAPSNLELTLKMLSRIKSGNTETVFVDSDDHEGIQAAIDEAEVLINSTPLGMADGHGNEIRLPIPENIVFDKRLIVADCVYNPDETLLIKKALSSGCRTIKGIKMLEEQARCGVDFLLGRY